MRVVRMKSDFSAFLFASTQTKDSYRIQQSAIESFYLQLDSNYIRQLVLRI